MDKKRGMLIKIMSTSQSFNSTTLVLCLIMLLLGHPAYARKEYSASTEAVLVLETCIPVYEYEDEECKFLLTREFSFNMIGESIKNRKFKYVITAQFNTCDYTIWTCANLPEIGEWSVLNHKKGDIAKDVSPTFTLQCIKYNNNATLTHDYNLWFGEDTIFDADCGNYQIYKWGFNHRGNRASLENLYIIRFSNKHLYRFRGKKGDITISLVRDVQDGNTRYKNYYDDIFLTIVRHYGEIYYENIKSYVVPRIYFTSLESESIQFDPIDTFNNIISFTIIVQHPLSDDGTSWEYHRLKITKDWGLASTITIDDLGPVPRSEWDADWPDPATTPLWVKEPED